MGPPGGDFLTQEVISSRPAGKSVPEPGFLGPLKSHPFCQCLQPRRDTHKNSILLRGDSGPRRMLKNRVQRRKGFPQSILANRNQLEPFSVS